MSGMNPRHARAIRDGLTHREYVYQCNVAHHGPNLRAFKRFLRKSGMFSQMQEAYDLGCALAEFGPRSMPKKYRDCPYPGHAKARRREWHRGYGEADPMGVHHGRNV